MDRRTRVTSIGLVLGSIVSVQSGAAVATTLFDQIGPAGTVLLRTLFAAVALVILWRPTLRGHTRPELRLVALLGAVLAAMNLSFYAALDRIPLGLAVTFEFVGPLGVAIVGSRRGTDLAWAALAAAGIALLSPAIGGSLDALGVGFALLAGAFWAAYILLTARVGDPVLVGARGAPAASREHVRGADEPRARGRRARRAGVPGAGSVGPRGGRDRAGGPRQRRSAGDGAGAGAGRGLSATRRPR